MLAFRYARHLHLQELGAAILLLLVSSLLADRHSLTAGETLAREKVGWVSLPADFTPLDCRLRVLLDGAPLSFKLPAVLTTDTGAIELEIEDDIHLKFLAQTGGCTVSALVLSPREEGDVTVSVEARVPASGKWQAARLQPAGRPGVCFLGTLGGGDPVARGLYDPATDSGWDFSLIAGVLSLSFQAPAAGASGGPLARIEGRVPRGRETVIFHVRKMPAPLLSPRVAARGPYFAWERVPREASSLGGCILPGGPDLVEQARALLETLPCLEGSYLEIGDGWQGGRSSGWFRASSRDWISALSREPVGEESASTPKDGSPDRPGKTEKQLGETVAGLKTLGFRPGVWMVPHGLGEETVFERCPEAFVRDSREDSVSDPYLGSYVVDGTSPEGLAYLEDLFGKLRSHGVTIVRLSGLSEVTAFYQRERGNLGEPDREPLDVCAATLRAMRRGCGKDVILAGDWDTPPELAGLLDAAIPPVLPRDGTEPLRKESAAAARAYFRHRAAWWVESLPVTGWGAESDAFERPEAWSRILFAALTGRGPLVDGAEGIPPSAGALLSRAWPPCDTRALDLFPRKDPPGIWDLKVGTPGSGGDIVGLFHWSTWNSVKLALDPEELGLRTGTGTRYVVFDLMREHLAGVLPGFREVLLLPGEAALFSVVEDTGRPRILGASGDLRETTELLAGSHWDAEARELRGHLSIPRGEGHRILHLSCGTAWEIDKVQAGGDLVDVIARAGHVPVRIEGERGKRLPFNVRFRRLQEGDGSSAPDPPRNVRISMDEAERCPLLEWDAGEDSVRWWRAVSGFEVLRDGHRIGRSEAGKFLDRDAPRGVTCSYAIAVVPRDDASTPGDPPRPAATSTSVSFAVPPAEDAFLDGWTSLAFEPGSAPPARRRSIVGGPLSVAGRRHARGLGMRPPSRVDYDLGGHYEVFLAHTGVDDASRFQGSVRFVVQVDGEERYRSALVRGGGVGPEPVSVRVRGGKRLSLIVEDGGDGNEGDLADWGDARVLVSSSVPLARAHAHNDYEQDRPLLDALANRFNSVEADVFLVDGKLLVAHGRSGLRPERTLEALYLAPLLERVHEHGGQVYAGGAGFTLLVDIKAEGEKVYPVLRTMLEEHSEMLTRFGKDSIQPGAVTVILSEDRPRELLEEEVSRYAAIDGRLPDLDIAEPAPVALIPLVSDRWSRISRWRGKGEMPAEERDRLREVVEKAHTQGRRVRFWATPDVPAVWEELWEAGVDLINADDLDGLRRFLAER